MCILYMCVSNQDAGKAGVSSCPYKLILASNRDEKFSRPTKPAYFWENTEDSHILAGQDLEELGTWLGVSKHGKLAVLLNIMEDANGTQNSESVSRGSLVTGFLRSPPGFPGCTYLRNLCHLDISRIYKPFHLITVDLLGLETEDSKESVEKAPNCDCKLVGFENYSHTETPATTSISVTYLSNRSKTDEETKKYKSNSCHEPEHITPPANTCRFYALGNSGIDKPFRKVECGKAEFESIVKKYCEGQGADEKTEDSLVQEILQFLKSTERYFPDENLEEQAKGTRLPKSLLPYFSSRYVSVPGVDYGTRTHTIVLVDAMNKVTLHEWTMKSPINPASPEWSHSTFTFTVSPTS